MSSRKHVAGRGVHDMRMDESLPPGCQKATFFYFATIAVMPTFMMNFGGNNQFPLLFADFPKTHPCFKKIYQKLPLFGESWAQKLTYVDGKYP